MVKETKFFRSRRTRLSAWRDPLRRRDRSKFLNMTLGYRAQAEGLKAKKKAEKKRR